MFVPIGGCFSTAGIHLWPRPAECHGASPDPARRKRQEFLCSQGDSTKTHLRGRSDSPRSDGRGPGVWSSRSGSRGRGLPRIRGEGFRRHGRGVKTRCFLSPASGRQSECKSTPLPILPTRPTALHSRHTGSNQPKHSALTDNNLFVVTSAVAGREGSTGLGIVAASIESPSKNSGHFSQGSFFFREEKNKNKLQAQMLR